MNKGFGILSMFVLIIIFALCLFLSAYSYQKFMSNEKDNYVNDIPTLKSENKTNVIKPMYDYKVLEDKLNKASLKYINENNLEDSISLVVYSNDLIDKKYLTDFYDLADYNNLCEGYVVYKDKKTTPYIWCKGSYATEGYDVNYTAS